MIEKCSICKKKFVFNSSCGSMVSTSTSGAMIISYVCSRCLNNKAKMQQFTDSIDRELCRLDSVRKMEGYQC